MKNRNHRKTNWLQKNILYIIIPIIILIVMLVGFLIGLSIGNNMSHKNVTEYTKAEKILSEFQITSDSVWEGEVRR